MLDLKTLEEISRDVGAGRHPGAGYTDEMRAMHAKMTTELAEFKAKNPHAYVHIPPSVEGIPDAGHKDGYDPDEERGEDGKWTGGGGGEATDKKWHREGVDRHETETFGHEDPEHAHGAVHPEWGRTRGTGIGKPDHWKAEAHGQTLGKFASKKEAKQAVEKAHAEKTPADKAQAPTDKEGRQARAADLRQARAAAAAGDHDKAKALFEKHGMEHLAEGATKQAEAEADKGEARQAALDESKRAMKNDTPGAHDRAADAHEEAAEHAEKHGDKLAANVHKAMAEAHKSVADEGREHEKHGHGEKGEHGKEGGKEKGEGGEKKEKAKLHLLDLLRLFAGIKAPEGGE